MILPNKSFERNLFKKGYKKILAVDEVGMGSLAGPVVVCAVLFDKKFFDRSRKKLRGVRDSKLMSSRQRETVAALLFKEKLKYKLSFCYPKTIDRINIYQAARLAMKRAVRKLRSGITNQKVRKKGSENLNSKSVVLVDGPNKIAGLNLPQVPVVGGDKKVFSIACASIIAKVVRDKMMTRYAKKFPGYGFDKHKGYGTKYHISRLAVFGSCGIHRKSFAPVTKLL